MLHCHTWRGTCAPGRMRPYSGSDEDRIDAGSRFDGLSMPMPVPQEPEADWSGKR